MKIGTRKLPLASCKRHTEFTQNIQAQCRKELYQNTASNTIHEEDKISLHQSWALVGTGL